MKVICISAKAQHGKDTVANFMKECLEAKGKRVLIAHYADLVKYICKTFFNWDGQKDEKGRTLLQYVGTDIVREKEPDYWVGFIADMLYFFEDRWDYVLIPDTRFPNEIDYLKNAGFDVLYIRVIRENFESPLTEEEMQQMQQIRDQLGTNFCRRCNYCAPCTVGISIPSAFLFAGYLERYNLADWAKDRYSSMAVKASACVGCGKCETRCPYHLPIREMLKKVAKEFGE